MAKYPKAEFDVFMSRVRTANPTFGRFQKSTLSPVLAILESDSGSASNLEKAVAALPEETRSKYREALRYLKWTYPGSDRYLGSDAETLRSLLTSATAGAQAIQTVLDAMSVPTARKYESALKKLMSDRSDVYYVGVESFDTRFTGTSVAGTDTVNDRIWYTSRHFHATAVTYSVVPANTQFEIGFIQICSAKTLDHRYLNDGLETRWQMPGGYPKSDSSDESNIPWYHVGNGVFCSNLTAARNHTLQQQETFELDDNFNNNSARRRLYYLKGGSNQSSLLKSIVRKQSFVAWFAVRRKNSTAYRLLRRVEYGFDFRVAVQHFGNQTIASMEEANVPIVESVPNAADALPAEALSGPITNDGEQLGVFLNGAWFCPINQTISLA